MLLNIRRCRFCKRIIRDSTWVKYDGCCCPEHSLSFHIISNSNIKVIDKVGIKKKNVVYKPCENCGELFIDKKLEKWQGVCSADCYSGRKNGERMKEFLRRIGGSLETMNEYLKDDNV